MDYKYNQEDKEKMKGFVEKLFDNPKVENETPLKKEEFIKTVIELNEEKLKSMFSSEKYFPNLTWDVTKALFLDTLMEISSTKIMKFFNEFVIDNIDFNFLIKLKSNFEKKKFKEELKDIVKNSIYYKEVREEIEGMGNILKYSLIYKYLDAISSNRKKIYFELIKGEFERKKFEIAEVSNYILTLILLKNIIYLEIPYEDKKGREISISYDLVKDDERKLKFFLQKLEKVLTKKYQNIPEELFQNSLASILSCQSNEISAAAKFTAIASLFGRGYIHYDKIDRGAEPPEKSFFSIMKRNYLYYGLDKDFLEELYSTAHEFRW